MSTEKWCGVRVQLSRQEAESVGQDVRQSQGWESVRQEGGASIVFVAGVFYFFSRLSWGQRENLFCGFLLKNHWICAGEAHVKALLSEHV